MICFKGSSQAEGQPAVTATQLEQGRTTPGDELEILFVYKDDDGVVGDGDDDDDDNEDDDDVVGDGVDGLGEERGYLGEDRQSDRSKVEGLLWWKGNACNLSYVIRS